MNRILIAALSLCAIAVTTAAQAEEAQAQEAHCLTPENALALARSERPGTEIMARHDGAQVAAILHSFAALGSRQIPAADEITVLHSAQSTDLLLIGSKDGCWTWRGQFSKATYEKAVWQAIGQPI